jgi:16S rRNA processing protein RimM
MEVVVGRIRRAHGIKGEAVVEVRTDDPAGRFVPGAIFATEPTSAGPLTVRSVRPHQGRLLVRFEEVSERGQVEALRGVKLVVEVPDDEPADGEGYYDQQLIGLAAVTGDGAAVGQVTAVIHLPGHDLLAVRRGDAGAGADVLIPFVREIVPTVDLANRLIVVQPPPGLLDPGEAPPAHSGTPAPSRLNRG